MKSHLKLNFLMLICVCLLSTTAIADEQRTVLSQGDRNKLITTAQKLARCGGVYDTASEIQKVINNPALNRDSHEIANGAEVAAAFLMASTGIIPDWHYAIKYAGSTRNSEKMRQTALFGAVGNYPEKINNLIGTLIESMNECGILSELQTELVQKARLWVYADQPKR